jgi:AcrR family transcriptional regulator
MGRPREFCVDTALDAALRVFWAKGYEGTSYADLTAATGVERPALYAAFGNKEALFRRALARYEEHYVGYGPEALRQPTARAVAEHFLHGAVALTTQDPAHAGCLGVNGALAASDAAEPIRQALIAWRAEGEAALRARFEAAQAAGDLPADADCAVLAAWLMVVGHGIAVQAKAGFCRATLAAIADQALAGWPATPADQKS